MYTNFYIKLNFTQNPTFENGPHLLFQYTNGYAQDVDQVHTVKSMEDRRSTRVCSLHGQLSQGRMANFPAFTASKSMRPSYTLNETLFEAHFDVLKKDMTTLKMCFSVNQFDALQSSNKSSHGTSFFHVKSLDYIKTWILLAGKLGYIRYKDCLETNVPL